MPAGVGYRIHTDKTYYQVHDSSDWDNYALPNAENAKSTA
jgi:hypothetical protein